MSGESAETFIGVAGLGVSAVLLFGAYKNVSVFGPDGLITTVVKTGKFPNLADVPPMFVSLKNKDNVSTMAQKAILDETVVTIASTDPALAKKVQSAFDAWNPTKDPNGSADMIALLAQMTANGMGAQVSTLRAYMAAVSASVATPSSGTPSSNPTTSNPVVSV